MNNKEKIKVLIELSLNFQDANEIIEKFMKDKTYKEKIDYLLTTFDCEIISRTKNDDYADYVALLTSIVNEKWH